MRICARAGVRVCKCAGRCAGARAWVLACGSADYRVCVRVCVACGRVRAGERVRARGCVAGRSLPDDHSGMINVGRLQPDMVLVSRTLKKIGLLEICRPIDESSSQLQAATARKLRTYAPLLTALKPYLDDGWQVQILPWVVGVRGLVITSFATPVFKFLSIPSDSRTELLEETTLESIKPLTYPQNPPSRPAPPQPNDRCPWML
jgi:hypothetical protein